MSFHHIQDDGVTSISEEGDVALKGDVTLSEGTNIALSQTAQDIEITASVASIPPIDAQYITLTANGSLSNERVLTGTANQITITDSGANGNATLSTPQNIHTGASPTFAGITLSITPLTSTSGGTGTATVTIGDLLYGSASNVWSKLADIATGNALISGGVGVAPSWGKIGLTTHITGTLPVANGGTGATTLGDAGVLVGNGTGAVTVTSAGTAGQVLTSNGAGVDPTFQAAGAGASEWTDGGTFLYPADLSGAEDIITGGTTVATADTILYATGAATFNEQGGARTFRVESDNDANAFVVEDNAIGTGGVGIGATPSTTSFGKLFLLMSATDYQGISVDGTTNAISQDDSTITGATALLTTTTGNTSAGLTLQGFSGSVINKRVLNTGNLKTIASQGLTFNATHNATISGGTNQISSSEGISTSVTDNLIHSRALAISPTTYGINSSVITSQKNTDAGGTMTTNIYGLNQVMNTNFHAASVGTLTLTTYGTRHILTGNTLGTTKGYGNYNTVSGFDTNIGFYTNEKVGINIDPPTAMLHVVNNTAAQVGSKIVGAASQSANLTEWQNSSAAILAQVNSNGAFIFNEQGADADSRIEGDTDINLTYWDAGADRVGIGTATPGSKLDVVGSFQVDSITNDTGLAHGTYTPTRSAETNITGTVTMTEAQYMRVGNTVTVSGRFTADPVLTSTATSFEITLPVASNIGAVEDMAGVAFSGAISGQGAEIIGNVANDTAIIQWIAGDVTSQSWSYTFTYQVI